MCDMASVNMAPVLQRLRTFHDIGNSIRMIVDDYAGEFAGIAKGTLKVDAKATGSLFEAFISDLLNGRLIGPGSIHVWPQAHRIDALPSSGCQFRFLGRTEDLAEDLGALFPTMDFGSHDAIKYRQHNVGSSTCKLNLGKQLKKLTTEQIKGLCKHLWADYVCFGYRIPAECQDMKDRWDESQLSALFPETDEIFENPYL
jgi:hypothetical protein